MTEQVELHPVGVDFQRLVIQVTLGRRASQPQPFFRNRELQVKAPSSGTECEAGLGTPSLFPTLFGAPVVFSAETI
jgi:hypothetical protein